MSSPKLPSPCALHLELTMRDVLDGLEQLACAAAFDPHRAPSGLEILSIEPAKPPTRQRTARIHPLPVRRTSNVLDYLLQRERRRANGG